ncbi:MAG: hypothetical protein WC358_00190 [Ignavibacteria bacterium]|jgi:hypothetical protein
MKKLFILIFLAITINAQSQWEVWSKANVQPSNTTYNQIVNAINSATLTTGSLYKISDYVTKHIIPGTSTVNTGTVEPIVVIATSSNTISKTAYSITYPKDYIEYDYSLNLCEDGITARAGFITKRIDNIGNDTPYDMRNVKFRRWGIDWTSYSNDSLWNAERNYIVGNIVKSYRNGDTALFLCVWNRLAVADSVPQIDTMHWQRIIGNEQKWCSKTTGNYFYGKSLDAIANYYIDYYTFADTSCRGNKIEKSITGLNNIVMMDRNNYLNTFEKDCYNITLYRGSYKNSFGKSNYEMILIDSCYFNTTFQNVSRCIIKGYENTLGITCWGNVIYSSDNLFGVGCTKNVIGDNANYCTFGNNSSGNILADNCHNVTFGVACSFNHLGPGSYVCRFNSDSFNNTLGRDSYSCIFEIDGCYNTFGDYCYSNYIGIKSYTNTFGHQCSMNIIKNWCSNNTFGAGCYLNTLGSYSSDNTIPASSRVNLFMDYINSKDFTGATQLADSYSKIIMNSNANAKEIWISAGGTWYKFATP